MIVASTMDSTKTSAAKILNLATSFSSQYGLPVHIGSWCGEAEWEAFVQSFEVSKIVDPTALDPQTHVSEDVSEDL